LRVIFTDEGRALVEARGVKVHYKVSSGFLSALLGRTKVVRAVDGVDLSIPRGGSVGLVGESGSGKTTLGRALLGLVELEEGSVLFDGTDVSSLKGNALKAFRRRTQMVFQDPYTSLDPRMRIGHQVEEPLKVHGICSSKEERRQRVLEILEKVGLVPAAEFYSRYPHQLSGGQRQRAAIARALVVGPEFLVADEPVSNLDVSARAQILNLLRDLRREMNLSLLFITHDLAAAWSVSDKIFVMYLGKIVEEGTREEVLREPLHPYTQALVSVIHDPKRKKGERLRISGEVPSPLNVPQGCRFHPRCPFAMDVCRRVEPQMIRLKGGRAVACHLYS
jgi:peptide/nickel transport system ATP-binding protein